jgi:drug/metabolite transporter (DMT)-like permease
MWLLYAICSGLFYSFGGIIARYLLKGKKDAWAYSFWFSFVGAIIVFPFVIINYEGPKTFWIWLLGITICLVIILHNYMVNKATNFIEPSLQGSITKFRLLWILILGVLLLNESFTTIKLLGTILTVIASFIIVSRFKAKTILIGLGLTFFATFIYAGVITCYSFFLKHFNTVSLTFFIFLFSSILNLIFMPHSIKRVGRFMKDNHPILIILATSFSAFGFLLLNQALSTGEQSKVVVITEASLIVTLIAEYLILKEKTKVLTKLIAITLTIAGAILVKIG